MFEIESASGHPEAPEFIAGGGSPIGGGRKRCWKYQPDRATHRPNWRML
ncbi:hypothetical protein [Streptomyces sp. NRRL S-31]|nr:hypothetical protein [Streptomyces sp. NRRL S-31]